MAPTCNVMGLHYCPSKGPFGQGIGLARGKNTVWTLATKLWPEASNHPGTQSVFLKGNLGKPVTKYFPIIRVSQ